jgi:hypothetical protein
VMIWLAEGNADYRIRCRGALKAAGQDPNQMLPLFTANDSMLPMVSPQSEEQLHGMIDKANQWLQDKFKLDLGCLIIDTFAQAGLFQDSYKPNEIIAVHQMLRRVAGSRKIDTIYTDHFNKKDKEHAAGTLNKRNDPDQILTFKGRRMIVSKCRYAEGGMWNQYRRIKVDDGNGNKTLAVQFGPIQIPKYELDNAGIFMSALENAEQDFGRKMRKSQLEKAFIDLHVQEQEENGIKSANAKEQARSAFRRELKSGENGGYVKVDGEEIWVL